MKNFRKIKERDIKNLCKICKNFNKHFCDESENTYILKFNDISYILIQQKNKEDTLIEIYKFYNKEIIDDWGGCVYGSHNKKLYNSKTHTEKLLRRCKRIVFCDRSFYNEI